jgi:hypothetical protein
VSIAISAKDRRKPRLWKRIVQRTTGTTNESEHDSGNKPKHPTF